jgi:hypothetical protein
MYGMVNQAVKGLVITKFGDEAWAKICEKAKVSTEDFVFMQYYPDEMTYGLVAAASEELALPAETILREFGKYWVLYTAKEGYGPLMDLFGSDFQSCLKNLNNLHARMGMSMPHLQPPRFAFAQEDQSTYIVSYFSKRAGLSAMVIGLLEGLAAKYGIRAEVQPIEGTQAQEEKKFRITVQG